MDNYCHWFSIGSGQWYFILIVILNKLIIFREFLEEAEFAREFEFRVDTHNMESAEKEICRTLKLKVMYKNRFLRIPWKGFMILIFFTIKSSVLK